jgi:hypothetical protein
MFNPVRHILSSVERLLKRTGDPAAGNDDAAPAPRQRRTSRPAAGEQTLWCEAGGHNWTRPAQPGRKPKSCPKHA